MKNVRNVHFLLSIFARVQKLAKIYLVAVIFNTGGLTVVYVLRTSAHAWHAV